MPDHDDETIRNAVRDRYGSIAKGSSCGCKGPSCCDGPADPVPDTDRQSALMGYTEEELQSVPDGANLGLGCGNPHAFALMRPGETVLDLGSGAGFDCFIASRTVGPEGKVIGVDMTPEMVSRARSNAKRGNIKNVDFRLGEIEHLPVADSSVDVIISNCVINLSPDKQSVFDECGRVLRPGGRLVVSDVIATMGIPPEIRNDLSLYSACAGGAVRKDEIEMMLDRAGFEDIDIRPKESSKELIREWGPGTNLEDYIVSAIIVARKP